MIEPMPGGEVIETGRKPQSGTGCDCSSNRALQIGAAIEVAAPRGDPRMLIRW